MMTRIVRSKYEEFKGSDGLSFLPTDLASFTCFDTMSSTFPPSKPYHLLGSSLLSCFDLLSSSTLLAFTVVQLIDCEGYIPTIVNAAKMSIYENEV